MSEKVLSIGESRYIRIVIPVDFLVGRSVCLLNDFASGK